MIYIKPIINADQDLQTPNFPDWVLRTSSDNILILANHEIEQIIKQFNEYHESIKKEKEK